MCATAPAITPCFATAVKLQNKMCRYTAPCVISLRSDRDILYINVYNLQMHHYLWLFIVFGLTGVLFCGTCGFIIFDRFLFGNHPPPGVKWSVLETTILVFLFSVALIELGIYLGCICYSDAFVFLREHNSSKHDVSLAVKF